MRQQTRERLGRTRAVRAFWWANLAVVIPAAVACSFPDIEYITVNLKDDSGVDATADEDGESPGTDASGSGSSGSGASSGEASSGSDDASGDSSSGDDAATGDGAVNEGGSSSGEGGPVGPPADGGGGSCSCAPDAMYPTNVSCGGLLGLLCGSTQGFQGSPACGQAGSYIMCSLNGLACQSTIVTRTQQCK